MPTAEYMLTATGAELAEHLTCPDYSATCPDYSAMNWTAPCGGQPEALAFAFGVILNLVFAFAAAKLLAIAIRFLWTWGEHRVWKVILCVAVCGISFYGMTKHVVGRVSVDDPYIRNAGSYVTNDLVHVAVVARFDFVPPTTEVLVFARELAQTNAEDWVQLTRIEEGPYRLGECPFDIPFANATNYNFLIAANYIPAPTVHTNGVWSIKGFIIPAGGNPPSPATYAFPNTKTIKREDQ